MPLIKQINLDNDGVVTSYDIAADATNVELQSPVTIDEQQYETAGGALEAAAAAINNIEIDIADLGISKIGISQIGMANGVASLDANGKIPVSQLPSTGSDVYRYNIVTKSTGGSDAAITIKKYLNEELVSSTDYPYKTFDHTHVIIDSLFDMIYAEDGQAKYTMTLLENSTDHNAGYSRRWQYNETVDFSETFIMSDEDISFIAPPFYANVSYVVGDKVTRNGNFYRCKMPHTGAWDIADFDKISVDELFDEVYDSLDDIAIDITQLGISKVGISQVGIAGGVASLGNDGKVPNSQLPAIPTKVSELQNDSGFITGYTETDPTVPAWAKASTKPSYTASEVGAVATTAVGSANGVAELDSTGKVPAAQLPSFVDEIIEGYLNPADGKFYEESTYETEILGEEGKIYTELATNKTYR